MNHKHLFAMIASVSFVGLGMMCQIASAQPGEGGNSGAHVPGRVLVKFKDGVSDGQARGLLAGKNALSTDVIPQIGVHVVQLPPNADEQAFANGFKGLDEVEFVEVDQLRRPSAVSPNDPLFGSQVLLPRIKAPDAWAVTTGNAGITIAVIDTGVDSTHPDLTPNRIAGWNFLSNNSDTTDVGFHGTYMMGTVAAATNNSLGVAGMCWSCKVMPLRVSDNNGSAADSTVASAILWAKDRGVRIALVGYPVTGSATVAAAAQQFVAAGGIVIVPAGNDTLLLTIPDSPYMLTVGATNSLDELYSWTNTGTMVDLVAPGSTYTTATGGGYANQWGSSFSAAYAAGVAALVKAANGSCTGQGISDVLKQSADDLGTPGRDNSFGWGRLNAFRAVGLANSTTCTGGTAASTSSALTSSLNPSSSGQIVTFTATVSPSAATGTVTFFDGAVTLGSGTLSSGRATFTTSSLSAGSHSIAAAYGGNTSYNGSTSPVIIQTVNTGTKINTTTTVVSSLNPSILGNLINLTATVSPTAATGTVTFFDGGANIGSATVVTGIAILPLSSLSAGSHSITASYGGNSSYNGSVSTPFTQTVNLSSLLGTTTTTTSSLNPSSSGQLVTFTATVSPSAATGSVTFYDGGTLLATSTLSGGRATFTTSSLSAGTHSVTSRYNGNSTYNGSTSAPVSQSVTAASKTPTSTALTSSLNPSTKNKPVTFTATVSPSGAGGSVTFYDGTAVLGTGALSGGLAQVTSSNLAGGTHTITAVYGGSSTYNGSTSSALLQMVQGNGK